MEPRVVQAKWQARCPVCTEWHDVLSPSAKLGATEIVIEVLACPRQPADRVVGARGERRLVPL